jgi:regulator of RNase E activity RraA/ketosteroid isomerase-like protein
MMKLMIALWTFLQAAGAAPVEFTSSDVADAAEALTTRRAHMTHEIRRLSGVRVAGPAVTLRLTRDDRASSVDAGVAVITFLEQVPEGSVVVAVLDDDKAFAVFGASFAVLAKARNLAGFVIDGAARDSAVLNDIGLPVFARGLAAGSAGGHYRLTGTNVVVQCGDVTVAPGDYVVADEDGVAVAPSARQAEILESAAKRQREERALLSRIKGTKSYLQVLKETRSSEPAAAMKSEGAMDDIAELKRLNALYVDSVAHANAEQFETILANDFLCSNPDGSLVNRAEFLAQTGRGPTLIIEVADVRIRVFGDLALIHAETTFTLPDGRRGRGRYTDVWVRRENRWLAVSAHVTRVM